jgi:hypothetical protein
VWNTKAKPLEDFKKKRVDVACFCIQIIFFVCVWYWGLNSGPWFFYIGALITWSMPPVLFAFWLFWGWGLLFIWQAWTWVLTDLHHHPTINWDGVSQTFCPGWPWSSILLIATSRIAMITGLSRFTQPQVIFSKVIF